MVQKTIRQKSYQFILLFGLVSMFGDITYEGGRSISGSYLGLLGASAIMIGFVGGLGEFIGYAFRLASGYFADKTKAYWLLTFIGYGLLIAMPLLAFTNNWPLAAFFIVLERFGKAVRTPAKDVMLSHATKNVGRGFGFAIHEAIDSIGGIIGPLIFTTVFFLKGGYRQGFALLWIPALLTIVFLMIARKKVPYPEHLEEPRGTQHEIVSSIRIPATYWWYTLFAFLSVAGFTNFQLMAYHFKVQSVITDAQIALFYAVAMGADALVALIVGKAYDKIGLKALVFLPLLSIPIPLLAFGNSFSNALISVILWGSAMAIHETIMRAAIADMVPSARRGFAYGIFNAAYGASWFVGSFLMGVLYDTGIQHIATYAITIEIISLLALAGLYMKLITR